MTVKELKKQLNNFDDNMEIKLSIEDEFVIENLIDMYTNEDSESTYDKLTSLLKQPLTNIQMRGELFGDFNTEVVLISK